MPISTTYGRKRLQDAITTASASQLASDPASPLRGVASALTWHRQRAGLAAALNLSSIKIGDPNFMCVLYECHYPNSRHVCAHTTADLVRFDTWLQVARGCAR